MSSLLVIDSSTLFALEKSGLTGFLLSLKRELIVPKAVKVEIEEGESTETLRFVKVVELKGRSLKKCLELQKLGIGWIMLQHLNEEVVDERLIIGVHSQAKLSVESNEYL